MNKAIFLDRDGVLNRVVRREQRVTAPWSFSEFEIIDEARALVKHLKSENYLTIVVTNQPDVAHGRCTLEDLERMHQKLKEEFGVDEIEVCTSADNSDRRRKPNPGMLLDAGEKFKIDLSKSFFVGDSEKDLLAGKQAGTKTILLETDYNLAIHGKGDFNCKSHSEIPTVIKNNFTKTYLEQTKTIAELINPDEIEELVRVLREIRNMRGRLFLVGCGGGAGHASHAVCDFRKLCGIEAYCPLDNVSELTARINDEGWDSSLAKSLEASHFGKKDGLFVFSVGGGSKEKNISMNLVGAVIKAKEVGAKVLGIVGRDGGLTKIMADACVVVPTVDTNLVTPHTEAFQAVVWHLLVSHPLLQLARTKWESTLM